MERTKPRRGGGCFRGLLYLLSTGVCVLYWTVLGSLICHHSTYQSIEEHIEDHGDRPPKQLRLSRFEATTRGELRSTGEDESLSNRSHPNDDELRQKKAGGSKEKKKNESPKPPPPDDNYPTGECAINLYGLPRKFKDNVLPSLRHNVISVNRRYRCDYFVHYFDVEFEESESLADAGEINKDTKTYARGGNAGGALHPEEIFLLREAVGGGSLVQFTTDTNEEFATQRKDYIDEIVFGTNGDQASNPYFVQEPSYTDRSLLNILKMWHSQDRVWNLMNQNGAGRFKYKRVAMLRLDVIYTQPIDVYKIPTEEVPDDYNQEYLDDLRMYRRTKKKIDYFYNYGTNDQPQHCVVPGFKSFPVNDRYFAGPYEAVEIWARDRFARARKHVTEVLPALESKRLSELPGGGKDAKPASGGNNNLKDATNHDWGAPVPFTNFGLHDERFVAYTILPAIREAIPTTTIRVDREVWFVRVRSDGSMWLRDKPGYGKVPTVAFERALGRKCSGKPYEVKDPVLGEKSPGLWQLKCPPHESSNT